MIVKTFVEFLNDTYSLHCLEHLFLDMKVRALSKYIPKCFCQPEQTTGALLKTIFGWDGFFNFLENITSWACLFKKGLNEIFYLSAHSDIFGRSLFNSFVEILLSFTTERREVSSAKSFTVDNSSSDRWFM